MIMVYELDFCGGMPISVLTQIGLGHFGLVLVRLMWADAWTEMGTSLEPIGQKWFDRSGHYFRLPYHMVDYKYVNYFNACFRVYFLF